MKLKYNVKIAQLCSNIPHQIPYWDYLFRKIQERGMLDKEGVDVGTIIGFTLEEHVKNCLETKVKSGDLEFQVILGDPAVSLNGEKRFGLALNKDGSVKVYDYSMHNGLLYCEFDYCANVDGTPTFFEVSAGRYANKGGRKYNGRGFRKNSGIKRQFGEKQINRIWLPLKTLFRDNFTYVFVLAKDVIDTVGNKKNSNLSKVVKDGGLVIPFYATREQFRADFLEEYQERRRVLYLL